MQIKQITATTTLLLLAAAYALPQDTVGDHVGDVIDDVINGGEKVINDIANWDFPSIQIPDDVNQLVNNIKDGLSNAPQELWKDISNNQWPQDVENWIKSLPQNMQNEARKELRELADEHLGNGTNNNNSNDTGAASSINIAMFTVGGLAGVVALFMAL